MMKIQKQKGFTILEILLAVGIGAGIIFVIAMFINNILSFQPYYEESFSAEQDIQQTLEVMTKEMRAMNQSNIGDYAIIAAASTSITFFSDIDQDTVFERIRYFLDNTTFRRAVLEPTGNPLVYNPANEVISSVVANVTPGYNIFSYYDENYTGTGTPLVFPVTIADIRIIETTLTVDIQEANTPGAFSLSRKSTPRNLRSNL